jgi:hypothetical protein
LVEEEGEEGTPLFLHLLAGHPKKANHRKKIASFVLGRVIYADKGR